jgi:response regulator RpfG family c-di-GMP phosphodiesterase
MNNKPMILVVEDDPVQLKIAIAVLQSPHLYEVFGAANVAAATDIMESNNPDLIISDNYMDGATGIEFCQTIKGNIQWRKTMFMLLTAEKDVMHKIQALDLGADDYVNKPYHPDEFLSRVRVLLRIKMLQDSLEKESAELRHTNEALNQNFEGMINLLTTLITLRIPNAAGRGADAARLCRWMAERLNFESEKTVLLDIAARFHEIGKITLADGILQVRPDQLSIEQKRRVVESTLFAEKLMLGIQQFYGIAKWLRHQMENYDGTGYPDKLRCEEIPIEARLLRAVNYVEELTPEVLKNAEALADVLKRARNTILDPRIAQLIGEYIFVNTNAAWMQGKRQIAVFELKEGMKLATDLSTGSGKKLLPKETVITEYVLERILSQHHYDPIISGIYVYAEES